MVKVLQIIAGAGIASAGLYIFTRQVDIGTVAEIIRQTALWKIIAVMVLNVLTLYFRSLRWRFLLPQKPLTSKKDLFGLVTIGFMVNNIIPFRVGEAVRALLTWKRNRFTLPESIGSLVVERFLDVLVFASFLCLPVLLLPELVEFQRYAFLLAFGLGTVCLLFIFYAVKPGVTVSLGRIFLRPFPVRVRTLLETVGKEVLSNLDWLFSVRTVVSVAALSFITLFCQIGMLSALGADVKHFSVLVSMFGVAFAAIGAAIPLAPGYVGTLHAMVLKGLGMAGISSDTAGALAVMYHAIGYITLTLLGLFFFIRLKVTFKDVRSAGKLKKVERTDS